MCRTRQIVSKRTGDILKNSPVIMFLVWSIRNLKTVPLKALNYCIERVVAHWKIMKHSLNNVVANLHKTVKLENLVNGSLGKSKRFWKLKEFSHQK